jgi:hypothetical protein
MPAQVLTESELPESYENIRKRSNLGMLALPSSLETSQPIRLHFQEICLFTQWTQIGAVRGTNRAWMTLGEVPTRTT